MEFDIENEKVQMVKDGKIIDCDILFTFDSEDTLKSYVGYTDHSFTNGRKNIFVSAVNPFGEKFDLEDITDPKEIEMVERVLNQIDRESQG